MKIQDIKIGEVYKTTTETPGWNKGDFFKVVDICADPAGEPFIRADFTDQGFGQSSTGIYHLREYDVDPIGPEPSKSFSDALDRAFPDPEPNTTEWESMGTAGARFAGYLTALSHLKAGEQGSYHAHKAMVDFLKHIGYEEVAGLYEKFV